MSRTLAFLAATAVAALAVTSACFAGNQSVDPIRFTLEPARTAGEIQVSLRSGRNRHNDNLTDRFAASQLTGLDLAALRTGGSAPVRFALVREPGRVDCAGRSNGRRASGGCRFTADPAFTALLASRGIARPTTEQSYGLTVAGANRDLVEAINAARYQVPTVDELTGLAAVGVNRRFIDDLARRGYRPARIDDLVGFRALDITPDYIDAMSRAGFRNLDADAIVQFKALGISPAYVADLARMGYSGLATEDVIQLKALNVTPAFIEGFAKIGYHNLSVDRLVELKALDVTPEYVRSLRDGGLDDLSAGQLVALRAVTTRQRK